MNRIIVYPIIAILLTFGSKDLLISQNSNMVIDSGDLVMENLGTSDTNHGIKWSETTNPVFGITYNGEGTTTANRLHFKEYITGGPGTIMTIKADGNVGIGTSSPMSKLSINGKINIGNDGLADQEGDLRYNNSTHIFEGYNGTSWNSLSGGSSSTTPYEIKDLVDQNTVIGTYDGSGSTADNITMAVDGFAGIKIEKNPINDLTLQFPNSFNTGNTLIGDQSGLQLVGTENTFVGYHTGELMTKGIYSTAIGSRALLKSVANSDNTAIGYQALSFTGNGIDDSANGNDNSALRANAGFSNYTGSKNAFFGSSAARNGHANAKSVFIGFEAGKDADDEDNVGIGYQSLLNIGKSVDNGNQGKRNVAIGSNAGKSSDAAYDNVFIGYNSGQGITSGYANAYMGYNSGEFNTTGHHNTTVGFQAGGSVGTTSGDYNVNLGSEAAYNSTGDSNTRIGESAGRNSAGNLNVFIGHEAGYNQDVSNTLIISNDRDEQLIYGEFDNKLVRINGELNTDDGDIVMKNLGVADFDKGIKWSETNNAVFGMTYDGEGTDTENRLHIQEYVPGGPGKIMTIKANGNVGVGVTNPQVEMDVDGTLWLRQQTLSSSACNSTSEYGKIAFDSDTKKLAVCANIALSPAPENPGWFFLH